MSNTDNCGSCVIVLHVKADIHILLVSIKDREDEDQRSYRKTEHFAFSCKGYIAWSSLLGIQFIHARSKRLS
jgi:hypothetical protein